MHGKLAEEKGFEPSWEFPPNRISSAAHYDLFGTLPNVIEPIYASIFSYFSVV